MKGPLHYMPTHRDEWRSTVKRIMETNQISREGMAELLDMELGRFSELMEGDALVEREMYARGLLRCVLGNPDWTLTEIAKLLKVHQGWLENELEYARSLPGKRKAKELS